MKRALINKKERYKNYLKIFLTVFFIVITIFFASIFILASHIREICKNDSLRLYTAGQSRMLWQMIIKEILLYEKDAIKPGNIESTISIFDNNLFSIINGGEIILTENGSGMFALPPDTDEIIRSEYNKLIPVWKNIKNNLNDYIKNKDNYDSRNFTDIEKNFLNRIDTIVFNIQKAMEDREKKLYLILLIVIIFLFIVLLANIIRPVIQFFRFKIYVNRIEKILPICCLCKKIRTGSDHYKNKNKWLSIEEYLWYTKNMKFSHSLCPDCVVKVYPQLSRNIKIL
jgi:nitrate/nitrite-specific signal transduction histidine kinase